MSFNSCLSVYRVQDPTLESSILKNNFNGCRNNFFLNRYNQLFKRCILLPSKRGVAKYSWPSVFLDKFLLENSMLTSLAIVYEYFFTTQHS